ncbi:MAG: WD40 repeat domain-containing protein [Methylobacter sp.]|nr:WD40 repeat domain-containing protein [Methylobacter sp.]
MAKNTLAIVGQNLPSLILKDGVTGLYSAPSVLPVGTGNGCAFSPDGTKLAVCHAGNPFVTFYNTNDWSKLANPSSLPNNNGNRCAFSPDGSKLAVGCTTSPFLAIYNTSDWSRLTNPATIPPSQVTDCAFSSDGTKLAVAHTSSPYITIYNVSDWSKIPNPTSLPAGAGYGCAFSPDGTKLAVAHGTSPYITLYNTSDWSKIANPTSLPASNGNGCAFSPDGTKLAVAHGTSPFITIYNTSNWSKISLSAVPIKIMTAVGKYVVWRDNTYCLLATDGCPGIIEINATTGLTVSQDDIACVVNGIAIMGGNNWKIDGNISESLAASSWTAAVYDYASGALINSQTFTGTSFSVVLNTPEPVKVTVSANQGGKWTASKTTSLDALAYPTNPINTPYYYQATAGGVTGVSEPVWPITEGGTVVDGTVTWTRVERLIQPITQAPLIPTPV